jgi:hypothetical protein
MPNLGDGDTRTESQDDIDDEGDVGAQEDDSNRFWSDDESIEPDVAVMRISSESLSLYAV